jgi:hypothetical protein
VYAHIYHHHVSFFDDIGEMKLLQVSRLSVLRLRVLAVVCCSVMCAAR